MTNLSNLVKFGSLAQIPAGISAIVKNDVVLTSKYGALYSVVSSDTSATAIAGTTSEFSTRPNTGSTGSRRGVIVNTATGVIYTAGTGTINLPCIDKYDTSGALLATVNVGGASSTPVSQCLSFLSNGNILYTANQFGNAVWFAIFDPNLVQIVGYTAIASSAGRSGCMSDSIALSGGGFAIVGQHTAGDNFLAIYSNTGTSVYSPTTISGSPSSSSGATQNMVRLAQLSNGNIVTAFALDPGQTNCIAHAIFSSTGSAVAAFALVATLPPASFAPVIPPDIAVVSTGYSIGCIPGSSTAYAVQFSNSGSTLAINSQSQGNSVDQRAIKLVTDGVGYGLFGAYTGLFTYYNAAGTTSVTSSVSGMSTALSVYGDGFYDRGLFTFLAYGSGTAYYLATLQVVSNGTAITVSNSPIVMADISSPVSMAVAAVGDYAIVVNRGNGTKSYTATIKYLNTAILGVALTSVTAGNAGTLISVNTGPGTYPCNKLAGSCGMNFNHWTNAVSGNRGVMMTNGISLTGIGQSVS